MFSDLVNVQSIGAAIQNMLLAARELGIGSQWICNVLYAYDELCAWLEDPGARAVAHRKRVQCTLPSPTVSGDRAKVQCT